LRFQTLWRDLNTLSASRWSEVGDQFMRLASMASFYTVEFVLPDSIYRASKSEA